MSETTAEGTQDGNNSGATSAADEFKPITSQEDLNRIIGERVKRVESKFADYGDLKVKAQQRDALSEASKSEQDKLTDRIASLESDLKESRLAAARAGIAREFELTKEQSAALKYAPSEEAMREIAEGLAADTSTRRTNGNRVASEGGNPNPKSTNSIAEFARGMFGDT